MELTDKQIKDLVERRHPEYLKKKEHWDFLASTYAGGRAWFTDNIFRYFKEGDQEFKERLERAYRFNHTREVVNLINKYLFKEDIHRNTDEASEQIRHFWRRATRQNASIDAFMAAIDLQSSIYGRIWVVVDSTMNGDVESVADEKNKDARAYAYWISPQQMLDVAWDDDGNMLWALIVEVARDDADPFTLMKNGSFIRILNQDAEIVERDILETGENITKVTFKKALAPNEMPVLNGVWTITEPDLEPMRVRIISIAQGDTAGSFDITAVENNPTKYEAIDNGATLIAQNTTVLDPTYSKPSNLQISEGTYISSPGNLSVKLIATWEGKSPEYWISWRRSDENHVSNWQSARVTEEQYEIANVAENGQYDFQLYAVSFSGKKTEVISTVYKVLGTMTPPSAPSGLTAVGDYRNVILNWVNPDSVDLDHINVYASRINDLSTAKLVAEAASTTFTHAGLGDSETWFYWVRAVNKRGMLSPPNSNLGTEAMTRDVLSFLTGKITSSELGQELLEEIDTKVSQEAVDAIYQQMEDSLNSLGEKLTAVDQRLEEAQSSLKTEVAGTLDKVGQALQQVEGSNAALVELQNTVSEQGKSVAGVVEAANAALDKASALIAEEREARVEADLANAKQIDAMKSSVDDSVAAVEEMKRTVAGVEQASTEVTTSLEALARANIDLALRQDEDQYKQSVTNAKISTTQKTFADDISAMASKVEEIRAEIGDNIRASITEETTSRVEADKAIASQITRLEARLNDDIAAALTEEQEARATADETLLRQITALKAQTDENVKAAISVETKARTDADSALATQISTLKSQTAQDIQAAVAAETKARTDADSALSGQITSLQAQTKDISAAVTSESSARANADGALGSRIDTLKASVDGHTATIQQQAQAIADTNKKVSTAWTLKMETAASGGQRYVAGIALGIDTTGLSQFLVQADRFGLVNSVNGRITTPFVVENGVAYMNGAYIKDGTITHAKVGDLQSTNFVSGRSGWRLGKNGVLEINGSSGGHGRLVITGQRIDVYDDNNVLRVRLGQL
ncbi:DUF1983 domain-containing protein [Cronobacter sakazakii]